MATATRPRAKRISREAAVRTQRRQGLSYNAVARIRARVLEGGPLQLKSKLLRDEFVVTRDAQAHAPGRPVSYSLEELGRLAGVSAEEWKLIHEVKALFGGSLS